MCGPALWGSIAASESDYYQAQQIQRVADYNLAQADRNRQDRESYLSALQSQEDFKIVQGFAKLERDTQLEIAKIRANKFNNVSGISGSAANTYVQMLEERQRKEIASQEAIKLRELDLKSNQQSIASNLEYQKALDNYDNAMLEKNVLLYNAAQRFSPFGLLGIFMQDASVVGNIALAFGAGSGGGDAS